MEKRIRLPAESEKWKFHYKIKFHISFYFEDFTEINDTFEF